MSNTTSSALALLMCGEDQTQQEIQKCFLRIFGTLVLWFISIPLYVMVEIVLIKYRKQLNSSFFDIAVWCGIADLSYFLYCRVIFGYFLVWFFQKQVQDSILLATMSNMGTWGLYYSQVFGVLLTAVNRYTALVMPLRYKTIWRRNILKRAIFLQWFLPTLVIMPMFLPGCSSQFDKHTGVAWLIDEKVSNIYWTGSVVVECFVFAPILILLYGRMVVAVYHHNNRISTQDGTQRATGTISMRMEIRCATVGGLLSFLYIILCSSYVLLYFGHYEVHGYIDYVWRYIPDIFTGVNPFFLLIFCRKVRMYFGVCYLGKTETQSQSRKAEGVRKCRNAP